MKYYAKYEKRGKVFMKTVFKINSRQFYLNYIALFWAVYGTFVYALKKNAAYIYFFIQS